MKRQIFVENFTTTKRETTKKFQVELGIRAYNESANGRL